MNSLALRNRKTNSVDSFNKLWGDLFNEHPWNLTTYSASPQSYSSNWKYEVTEEGMEITVDLPGTPKKDVEVSVEGRVLSITNKEDKVLSLKIGTDYDLTETKASMKDGRLKLVVGKAGGSEVVSIKVT